MSVALTAIISQTYNKILSQLLENHGIGFETCQTYEELIEAAQQHTQSELIFVSRELIRSSGQSVMATIAELRSAFSGSIYILSSSPDESIHEYIQAGATDVVLTSKIKQIEEILQSFRIYLDSQTNDTPYTVLLVEDSKSLSQTVTAFFEAKGIRTIATATAQGAVDLLQTHPIDAIVCDLVLEGTETGLEVVRRTYQNSRWKGIPIMITTSFTDTTRQKHLYHLGVSDVLQKPYDLDILTVKIAKMAREHRIHQMLLNERIRAEKVAYEDPETGLNNRAFVKSSYSQWVAAQPGDFYAMLIEIDSFQDIKREYGINQSETALKNVADVMKKNAPEGAVTAHLTGEQFVMLLPFQPKEAIEELAKRLINDVSGNWVMEHKPMSICVGISEGHQNLSLNDALKIADGCLYLAKEEGPGQYEIT